MSTVPSARAARRKVAVLGATGAVGQAFIRRLAAHPWFELTELAASERSAGKPYAEAARWIGNDSIPASVQHRPVVACDPAVVDADIVFSALDASVAGEVEAAFARAGKIVLSNARNYRMEDDVPLVIPEVNPEHLGLIARQRERRGWPGAIVTNANCSTIGLTLALAPLHERFRIERVFVATMQAVSGAGYPGVPSLDILGNVVPFIGGEEEKIEAEALKMLGRFDGTSVGAAPIAITAHANRVPVEHGHTICVSVGFAERVTPEAVREALEDWGGSEEARGLPTAPPRPLELATEPDRPQPRRDVDRGNGMAVTIGRIRRDPMLDVKFVALAHNIVRGAAGASVLNAELMERAGMLPE
ncbi:MAG TPA: aspartate-semialdehyde dehydrogenase [Gemmatimonadaceae bacterium]|nr:aspartate-semialdehyde dehydrogenase [Gemmatimonadaceae bacterium]